MADQGPLSPSSWANDMNGGDVQWDFTSGNPGSNDGNYAQSDFMSVAPHTTYYLRAYNFGFSIPVGSTLTGYTVEIDRKGGYATAYDDELYLCLGTTRFGSNKAAVGTVWPFGEAYATYGGAADMWGTAGGIALGDVNTSSFGVSLTARVDAVDPKFGGILRVDHMRITVHYTPVGGIPNKIYKTNQAIVRASRW